MDKKKLGTYEVIGGMALLLLGRKIEGLALFGKGFYDLEKVYRENNDDLASGLPARWERAVEFYEDTHQDKTNRMLHVTGIPMIVGGAVGLLSSKPYKKPWLMAGASFAAGWALNIIGHAKFEKNKPAFTDDPLSFIAGPVWDAQQLVGKDKKGF